MAHHQDTIVGFKAVAIFKEQVLGIGSYGKVCKAKCDHLLCAAKLIHETLFEPLTLARQEIAPQRVHRLPMRRFEQECEFLSTIRHPNIIQYLGISRDPDTGLPALLMELMDDSLTHFLESRSTQPTPYHIQVNICHNITLALSFLHSNDIVHRDLSSNNVLLIGNIRAKVTDFGMARLSDQNARATYFTSTLCPGTDVYMPPEAVQDRPVYTEKIDCFSFGVITVQILTRQFPEPGDRRKEIQIDHPGLPSGSVVEVRISEVERRQNHISEIDPNHTMLPIAIDCLKDRDIERPSAHQLCERVAALKESPAYNESVRTLEQNGNEEREREITSLRQQHAQQVFDLESTIRTQTIHLETKDDAIMQKDQALRKKVEIIAAQGDQVRRQRYLIDQLEQEKNRIVEERNWLERELGSVKQQLSESRLMMAGHIERATSRCKPSIEMRWKEGAKAPCKLNYSYNAAVDSTTVYIRTGNCDVYAYTASLSTWSQLPSSPTYSCPFVIVNNLPTLVGGYYGGSITNKLFSLIEENSGRRWTEEFPSMPTNRYASAAVFTGTTLIVAGGRNADRSMLPTVEVMHTEILQWSTATDLPQPLSHAPAAVCDDRIYVTSSNYDTSYSCSVSSLIQSHGSTFQAVWHKLSSLPVTDTVLVSAYGQLLTIGGQDLAGKPTTSIHMYDPVINSWEVISHMAMPRSKCCAAVLPNNRLVVVGGWTGSGNSVTDSVEVATIQLTIE